MDFEIPDELHYTSDDEWVLAEDDSVTVGVTDFAQQQLGDIVYVELPTVGDQLAEGVAFGVIESVKAVSDLNAPVSGEVVAINEELSSISRKSSTKSATGPAGSSRSNPPIG